MPTTMIQGPTRPPVARGDAAALPDPLILLPRPPLPYGELPDRLIPASGVITMLHRPIPPLAVLTVLAAGCAPAEDAPDPAAEDPQARLLARAEALELPGEYVLPPGDALVHSTAGFAKILCSNVFLSGLDPDFAAEHTGFFSAPARYRGAVTDRVPVPGRRAVACQLGGADGRILFCLTCEASWEDICAGGARSRVETARVAVPGAGSP